nr:HlyD family secretion protein [Azospirillum sp. SYSU D00513]
MSLNRDLLDQTQSTWRELETARAEAQALKADLARLDVTAPFAGVLVDVADPLATGEWVKRNDRLATLIDPRSSVIEAYVREEDLRRIGVGTRARFLPDDPSGDAVDAEVTAIATASSRLLTEPSLASVHGGGVPSYQGQDQALVPEKPVYRVLLRATSPLPAPARVERGAVRLEGERESIAAGIWRTALGVLVRESGF